MFVWFVWFVGLTGLVGLVAREENCRSAKNRGRKANLREILWEDWRKKLRFLLSLE